MALCGKCGRINGSLSENNYYILLHRKEVPRIYVEIPWYEYIQGEIWNDLLLICDTIGVSSCGRIRHINGRKTYGSRRKGGYREISIKRKQYLVHRLICLGFYPNDNSRSLQVNHKDGNKSNNNISNLEWCTASQNSKHARQLNKRGMNIGGRPVKQLTVSGDIIGTYPSISEASRKTNVGRAHIGAVCRGKHSTARGYVWEYC